ncbi:hypothetical protein NPIL_14291 [Nephila pilipes]|uniref:Uncharacterized protein n=1 Tax=Nephila pilipes TaxID=299642 RepID=A0A8X6QSA1_NEPPI|nr:hypothetical protein NPIL_14291 [Nephila pilipes]
MKEDSSLTCGELAKQFNVSDETIMTSSAPYRRQKNGKNQKLPNLANPRQKWFSPSFQDGCSVQGAQMGFNPGGLWVM